MGDYCERHESYSCAALHAGFVPAAQPLPAPRAVKQKVGTNPILLASLKRELKAERAENPLLALKRVDARLKFVDRVDAPGLFVKETNRFHARIAVEEWHYSHLLMPGIDDAFGVWEDGSFRGCVVFGRTAFAATSAPPPVHAISSCVVAAATTRAVPGLAA